jgi:uncharacterized membrane protein
MSKPPHSRRGVPQPQSAQTASPQQQPQHSQSRLIATQTGWSGPLPSPDALDKFNQIIPNGADRIVAMAEREQTHRIDTESRGLTATIAEAKRGQYLGAGISLMALAGAAFTAYIGAHWSVSVAFIGLTILGVVRALIRPRKDQ